jgi:ribosomal protein L7/L12
MDTENIKALWANMNHGVTESKIVLIKKLREFSGRSGNSFNIGLKEAKDKVESCWDADEMVAAFMVYS